MSYILDALRRAQAERDRGQIPGLDAQPLAAAPAPPSPRPAWSSGPAIVVAALMLVLVAALVLWWDRVHFAAAPVGDSPVRDAVPAPTTTSTTRPMASSLPIVVSAPPAPTPIATASAAPSRMDRVAPESAGQAPVATPSSGPTRVLGEAEPAAVPLAALSAAQRQQFPPLGVGGSVWSERRASRFVMINGLVVHEGDPAAPGVMVERIEPKSLIVRWRNTRIEVPY